MPRPLPSVSAPFRPLLASAALFVPCLFAAGCGAEEREQVVEIDENPVPEMTPEEEAAYAAQEDGLD